MRRLPGLRVGLALATASFLLTLTAIELALRTGLFSPTAYRSTRVETYLESNPRQPNFRWPATEPGEKGDAFRIVVVGDSFAWGDGVYAEDAFPHRLQTRLSGLSKGTRFEVVNWSRPGWNTVRQVRSLERALPGLEPDLVLLTFVLNDPEPLALRERDALLAGAAPHEPRPGLSAWLFAHSRFYAFGWNRLEFSRQHRQLAAYYRSLFEGGHWEACLVALRQLRRLARGQSVPLVLVVFPVFDGPLDERYAYRELHDKIRAAAADLKIPVLDLLETYDDVEPRRLPVIPFSNAHPNELAHRLAAEGILEYLFRRELLPPIRRPDHLRPPVER